MKDVRILNNTGLPKDTKIYIGDALVPLSSVRSLDISYRPDEFSTAKVELKIDELDIQTLDYTVNLNRG